LTEAEAVLGKLRGGREASGYDARRITRERVAAEAKVRTLDADLNDSWERLRTVMVLPAGTPIPPIEGSLMPPPPAGLEDFLSRLGDRPDLMALKAKVDASDLDRRAADRGWLPDVTLGAALKRVDQPTRDDTGVLFTVSAPLPLFDRGQAGSRKAASQSRATTGDRALASAKAEGELRGLWRRAVDLRETALRFRESSLGPSRQISRIAEGAYKAGEMTVLELLDAYKADLDAETTTLDLELGAREAHTDLQFSAGEALP
jgi:cobalt-zinc-cadmium efflux system outer membrane protein